MFRPCGLRQSRKISGAISVSCFIRRELIWQQKKGASKTTAKNNSTDTGKDSRRSDISTDSKRKLLQNEKGDREKKEEVKTCKK